MFISFETEIYCVRWGRSLGRAVSRLLGLSGITRVAETQYEFFLLCIIELSL